MQSHAVSRVAASDTRRPLCHVLPVPRVDVPCPFSSMLWQSRTRFELEHRPWDTYAPECQRALDRALASCAATVELTIKGAVFVVDMVALEQRNKLDPSRVRDVRRARVSCVQWFALNPSAPYDCIPFDEANNAIVERGAGERQLDHDAVLMEVQVKGKTYLIDKVRHRQYEKGDRTGRFRHLVVAPMGLVRAMSEGYARGRLPPGSAMYRRLVEVFDRTKHAVQSAYQGVTNDHVHVVSIEYAFSLDRFLMFQHHVRRGRERNPGHRVAIAFHGTNEKHHEAITRHGFDTKCIGKNTGNMGWFGKGIYFSERSFTALGYNNCQRALLTCLLSLERTFVTPMPDSSKNPYHGQPCKKGYDSHYSPTKKELVTFDPKQMLACFILRLNTDSYGRESLSDYLG